MSHGQKGDAIWVQCNKCKQPTEHKVEESFLTGESGSEEGAPAWRTTYEILCCNGCKTITYRTASSDEDSWNSTPNDLVITEELYPPRATGRESTFGFQRAYNPTLPPKVFKTYVEVIAAINGSLFLLAAVGIRLIVEAMCQIEKCPAYCKKHKQKVNLKTQINALAEKGLIAPKAAKILHKMRFLGNNAAHEIIAPEPDELNAALDIIELMLRNVYLLERIAKRITSTDKTERKEKRWERKAAKKAAGAPLKP